MLLVGSKALQAWMPINRIVHDWDFWMSDYEFDEFMQTNAQFLVKTTPYSTLFDIHGTVVEIKKQSQFAPTDQKIFDLTKFHNAFQSIDTPYGKARVPSIQIIHDMKAATALCIDEWKHSYDLKLIRESGYEILPDTDLFKERLVETQERIANSKRNKHKFFHKNQHNDQSVGTIPEYIIHDKLHAMIADLIGLSVPTYVRIINGDFEVDIELFHNLTHMQKLNLMAEESLVLALERWFIPQMVENGINYKLVDRFYSNNEASASYQLLKHVNIKGLKGEAPEITQFGRDNFQDIEKIWVKMKDHIRSNGGFPKWFYDELFAARDKYRNGEKVGIHHDRY